MKRLKLMNRGRTIRLRIKVKRAYTKGAQLLAPENCSIQKQRELEVCKSEFAYTLSRIL